jgi:hypothetical protein
MTACIITLCRIPMYRRDIDIMALQEHTKTRQTSTTGNASHLHGELSHGPCKGRASKNAQRHRHNFSCQCI